MSDVMARLTGALDTRYRIGREVGIGGMATVYLAHDLKHERDVAIKVLHPDLAAALGAERFLAEIKTTAKLQHPHILPLLESGEADGLLYYVMPYVAGESLRTRLDRETQLAVDDAVRIAREVASALDYAHRHGVVHRDIKPENILIHEDQALVADFGIALAVSAAGGPRMTQTGLSLGTPAYMAPEQAMGERAIDGRADIYALGAVTYEMLVGEAPFTGPTVQAIVARVMTESPRPVTGQRKSVPPNVNAAVLRALEKLPADRFHTPAEFSSALVTSKFDNQSASAARSATGSGWPVPRVIVPWAVAAIASVAAIALLFTRGTKKTDDAPLYLAVDLPSTVDISQTFNNEGLAISDDGTLLAIPAIEGGQPRLFLRSLRSGEIVPVQGSNGLRGSAVFSADGRWIAFNTANRIWKAPVTGGAPTAIGTANWAHLAWIGSSAIVYTANYNTGLSRISSEGRDTATLTVPDRKKGELGHWWPQVLPDGNHLLFTNYTTPADQSKIEILDLKSGKRQVIIDGGYYGRYVRGHLLFVRDAGLMAVPIDIDNFKTRGEPVHVALDVQINPPTGWAAFAVSPNGTLVYRPDALRSVALTWSNDNGDEEPAVDSIGRYTHFDVSPDGKRIAVVRDGDVWVYERGRKLFSRLTRTDQREVNLVWSPDSREVFYSRDLPQYEIFKRAADGSRPEEKVVASPNDKLASSVSPDGQVLLYEEDGETADIIGISPSGLQATRRVVLGGPGGQGEGRFSPDGKWIAYQSTESGAYEIYIAPYPADRGPSRLQVSNGGGQDARWSPDGRTLYYGAADKIMRVRVDLAAGIIGNPEVLGKIAPGLAYTVAPDGRFLVARIHRSAEVHAMKVVLNWASILDSKN
ncbi:MAG TPA: protein kinase [Gemmatimonadaceae bacterium]